MGIHPVPNAFDIALHCRFNTPRSPAKLRSPRQQRQTDRYRKLTVDDDPRINAYHYIKPSSVLTAPRATSALTLPYVRSSRIELMNPWPNSSNSSSTTHPLQSHTLPFAIPSQLQISPQGGIPTSMFPALRQLWAR